MPLFSPNLDCTIRRVIGRDVYADEILSAAFRARCAIVKLEISVLPTSVRADSAASRGAAEEFIGTARLLLPATVQISPQDQIEVSGYKLRVTSIFPRHSLQGKLDHYEINCGIWG
jgi:hypothetical protein